MCGSATARPDGSRKQERPVRRRHRGRKHFDHVRCEPAPDQATRVAEAIGQKYWSDILIRYMSHPLTCRLVPE